MNNLTQTQVTDCTGNPLMIGDLVIRSLYSDITFHRVLKINRRTVKLSRGRVFESYGGEVGGYHRINYCRNPLEVDLEEYNNHPTSVTVMVRYDFKTPSIFKIQQ